MFALTTLSYPIYKSSKTRKSKTVETVGYTKAHFYFIELILSVGDILIHKNSSYFRSKLDLFKRKSVLFWKIKP